MHNKLDRRTIPFAAPARAIDDALRLFGLAHYDEAIALLSGNTTPDAVVLTIRSLLRLRRGTDAIAHAQEHRPVIDALDDPDLQAIYWGLYGRALYREDDRPASADAYLAARGYALFSSNPDVLGELGYFQAMTVSVEGEQDDARAIVQTALRATSARVRALGYEFVGLTYIADDRLNEALETLERAWQTIDIERSRDAYCAANILYNIASTSVDLCRLDFEPLVAKRYDTFEWTPAINQQRFHILGKLAAYKELSGDYLGAYALLREAAAVTQAMPWKLWAIADHALLAYYNRDLEIGREQSRKAYTLAKQIDWDATTATFERMALLCLAELAAPTDVPRAQAFLDLYYRVAKKISVQSAFRSTELAEATELATQGTVDYYAGRTSAAYHSLNGAFSRFLPAHLWEAAKMALLLERISPDPRYRECIENVARLAPNSWLAKRVANLPSPIEPTSGRPSRSPIERYLEARQLYGLARYEEALAILDGSSVLRDVIVEMQSLARLDRLDEAAALAAPHKTSVDECDDPELQTTYWAHFGRIEHRRYNDAVAREYLMTARGYALSCPSNDPLALVSYFDGLAFWSASDVEGVKRCAADLLKASDPLLVSRGHELLVLIGMTGSKETVQPKALLEHLDLRWHLLSDRIESDQQEVASTLYNFGSVAFEAAMTELIPTILERYSQISWHEGLNFYQFHITRFIAWLFALRGDHSRAFALWRECVTIASSPAWRVWPLVERAILAEELNEAASGRGDLETAVALAAGIDFTTTRHQERMSLLMLAQAIARSSPSTARNYLAQYDSLSEVKGLRDWGYSVDPRIAAVEFQVRGVVEDHAGNLALAEELLGEAFQRHRRCGAYWRATWCAAELARFSNDPTYARHLAETSGNYANSWIAQRVAKILRNSEDGAAEVNN